MVFFLKARMAIRAIGNGWFFRSLVTELNCLDCSACHGPAGIPASGGSVWACVLARLFFVRVQVYGSSGRDQGREENQMRGAISPPIKNPDRWEGPNP